MTDNTPQGPSGQTPQPPAYQAPQPAPPAYGAPQQYGDPAYGAQPGYAAPYPYAPAQKTNVLAVVSLCLSIAGFIWVLPFLGPIAGVICGHISLSQIKTRGEKGRGMALAGLIIGYVAIAFLVIGVIALIAVSASVRARNGV